MQAGRPINVFLADRSAEIRRRMCGLLRPSNIRMIGDSGTLDGCISGVLATMPDVLVLDVVLRGGTGLQAIAALTAAGVRIPFVVCSNCTEQAYHNRYLSAGAQAFVDKSKEIDQLALTVTAVAFR